LDVTFQSGSIIHSRSSGHQLKFGEKYSHYIPKQLPPTDYEKAASVMSISLNSFVYCNIAMNMAISGSLQILWGMINTLQILTHVGLFSLNFPANVFIVLKVLMEVANFDLVPVADYEEAMFNFEETGPHTDNFEEMGKETKHSVLNMGTSFIILLFGVGMILVVEVFGMVIVGVDWCKESMK